MNKLKMAACGVDCAQCAQYKITTERDFESAELLVEWFRSREWIGENEGAEAVMSKAPLCRGCWNVTDDCFWKCGCGRIDFSACCKEKQIDHCGECGTFPCGNYKLWVEWHQSHKNAMDYLISLRADT